MTRDELIGHVLDVLDTDIPDEPTWSKIVIAKHVVDTIEPVMRAKVEALPTVKVDGHLYVGMVWWQDVLALFDGGDSDG